MVIFTRSKNTIIGSINNSVTKYILDPIFEYIYIFCKYFSNYKVIVQQVIFAYSSILSRLLAMASFAVR